MRVKCGYLSVKKKKAHFPAAISATLSQQFQVGDPDCLSSWIIVVRFGIVNPPIIRSVSFVMKSRSFYAIFAQNCFCLFSIL